MTDNSKKVEDRFLFILISNWIFGIGIMEYPLGTKRKMISYIYSILNISIYCVIIYLTYPSEHKLSSVNQSSMKLLIISYLLLILNIFIVGWFRSKSISYSIAKVTLINSLMERINIQEKVTKKLLVREIIRYFAFLFFILIMLSLSALILFQETSGYFNSIEIILATEYPIVLMYIVDTSFINMIRYVKGKFIILNERLRKLLTSTGGRPQHNRTMYEFIYREENPQFQRLQCIRKDYSSLMRSIKLEKQIHGKLVKLCQKIGEIYESHILFSIVMAFGISVDCVFSLYNILTSNLEITNDLVIKKIIINMSMMIYNINKIIIISWTCNSICTEATKSGDIICEIYDEPFMNEETKTEIRDFNTKLIENKLYLTVYGCFKLNFGLIQTMISIVATYSMFIIQSKAANKTT